jgi:hypothetical protein
MAQWSPNDGYMGKAKDVKLNKFMIIDGQPHEIYHIVVHEFNVTEDDSDMYAAVPIMEWQRSEAGTWVMQRSVQTPRWTRYLEHTTYAYRYAIEAWLKSSDHTYYQLKWGQKV